MHNTERHTESSSLPMKQLLKDYFHNNISSVYLKNFEFNFNLFGQITVRSKFDNTGGKRPNNMVLIQIRDNNVLLTRQYTSTNNELLSIDYSDPDIFNSILVFINRTNWNV